MVGAASWTGEGECGGALPGGWGAKEGQATQRWQVYSAATRQCTCMRAVLQVKLALHSSHFHCACWHTSPAVALKLEARTHVCIIGSSRLQRGIEILCRAVKPGAVAPQGPLLLPSLLAGLCTRQGGPVRSQAP